MIVLLAVNAEQGRHYLKRLFPEARRHEVKVATEPHHVQGLRGFEAIMVGEFDGFRSTRQARLFAAARAGGAEPVQGPRR